MLPFTPGGVLLQGGDARREPPIVLARRAGTPYRNGHTLWIFVAHRSSLPLAAAGSWHFRGDVRALALGHAGLLRWGWRRGRGPARARRRGGAVIGRAALRHKRFQEAGAFSCRTVRTRGGAAPGPGREAGGAGPSPLVAQRRPPPGRSRSATARPGAAVDTSRTSR